MLKLIDQILDHIPYDTFGDTELSALLPGTPTRRYQLVKRALAAKEMIQIRRGLYQLAPRYQRKGAHPYELAGRIYGPSYVSFESALSYHGLIPEAVYTVTCASAKKSREFTTPQGVFSYTHIPLPSFAESIERIEKDGHFFLMATPLKAIADYVYARKPERDGLEFLTESLRIDPTNLDFKNEEIARIQAVQNNARTSRFFDKLLKDLKKTK